MIQKTRRMMGQAKGEAGFTLVEMALVLIIIGIIIGAIVKGNDLVRSAEQKRFFRSARASAMEGAAVLDLCRIRRVASPSQLTEGRQLLFRLAQMLTKLSK